jgi:methylated-DNA-[protein]-cysteine S-methyltransferase
MGKVCQTDFPQTPEKRTRMMHSTIESPVGPLTVVGDREGLRSILFGAQIEGSQAPVGVVEEAIRQLQAYFSKKLTRFDLPLKPKGTPFQMEVWRELLNIPYGKVISYGELAERIGRPSASRAVGAANGSNPIPIIIPCHRVIGSNGRLTGYGGGVHVKEALLRLESVRLF